MFLWFQLLSLKHLYCETVHHCSVFRQLSVNRTSSWRRTTMPSTPRWSSWSRTARTSCCSDCSWVTAKLRLAGAPASLRSSVLGPNSVDSWTSSWRNLDPQWVLQSLQDMTLVKCINLALTYMPDDTDSCHGRFTSVSSVEFICLVLACQLIVIVGDSGLCCFILCLRDIC